MPNRSNRRGECVWDAGGWDHVSIIGLIEPSNAQASTGVKPSNHRDSCVGFQKEKQEGGISSAKDVLAGRALFRRPARQVDSARKPSTLATAQILTVAPLARLPPTIMISVSKPHIDSRPRNNWAGATTHMFDLLRCLVLAWTCLALYISGTESLICITYHFSVLNLSPAALLVFVVCSDPIKNPAMPRLSAPSFYELA